MGLMSLSSFAQQGLTAADSTRLAAYKLELAPIDQQMSDILAKARAGQIAKEQMDSIGELYTLLASQKEARILEIIKENFCRQSPSFAKKLTRCCTLRWKSFWPSVPPLLQRTCGRWITD